MCVWGAGVGKGGGRDYERERRLTDMAEPWTGATSHTDQRVLEHCCIMCVPIVLLCFSSVTYNISSKPLCGGRGGTRSVVQVHRNAIKP